MNTNNIKKYAPQARREFIEAVSKRLNQFGIYTDSKGKSLTISEPSFSGSVMQIDSNSFDAGLLSARKRLVIRAEQLGFDPLVEQVAYTWFNRLCAIRFMELKSDYLEHGLRVLSHPEKAKSFEILDHAQDVAEQLGLDREHIVELKLAGNKDEELYRHLLLGQCHQLHKAMPFLFEALDDETELLLPDNLTRTDSILRGLVDSIPEADWQAVEIIGWLYQFYISEKKDQVIGKVVKSEDIPAATQLFTPNWIVKYLVQNSIGRQWLMTYPDSSLKGLMAYYIEPAEQDATVGAALAAITPSSIEPESIKVLDPACGSGHILVEAYNLLKAIYEERGYRSRDIPKLILENNLFGLDIDDRAAQLAGFALMMKAREDDRRIFARDIKLNVFAIQSTQGLNLPELWRKLGLNKDTQRGMTDSIFDDAQTPLSDALDNVEFNTLQSVLVLFEQAKTFGSLIQVPTDKAEFLHDLKNQLQALVEQGDSYQKPAAAALLPFVQQAWLLAQRYDVVVANPPYMGGKYQTPAVKQFLKEHFNGYEKDVFSAFIVRNLQLAKSQGQLGFMTPFVWMFISSYEKLRKKLIDEATLTTLIQLEYSGFDGATVPICTFTLSANHIKDYVGSYIKLSDFKGHQNQAPKTLEAIQNKSCGWFYTAQPDDFKKIPGSPIAYWVSDKVKAAFESPEKFEDAFSIKAGICTGKNAHFIFLWHEVDSTLIKSDLHTAYKYTPHNKGGDFKKWAGNFDWVLKYSPIHLDEMARNDGFRHDGKKYYFLPHVGWSKITSSLSSFRVYPDGYTFDSAGLGLFSKNEKSDRKLAIGFLNSKVAAFILNLLNPTLNLTPEIVKRMPYVTPVNFDGELIDDLCEIALSDWNDFETSRHFSNNPLIKCVGWVSDSVTQQTGTTDVGLRDKAANPTYEPAPSPLTPNPLTLEQCFNQWQTQNRAAIAEMQRLEEENNRLFIEAYGLQDELSPEVPEAQITLTRADREKDCQRLISYAIGCMMGRYRLDKPGLIYAHAGNVDFEAIYNGVGADLSAHGRMNSPPHFAPDDDGIIPLTDQPWFKDDATHRFREFMRVVFDEGLAGRPLTPNPSSLTANLDFVAESLCLTTLKPKKSERNVETIRRYLSTQFYKDHLKTYKKRPIYWLFSSGKHKAFECLVYLHRYNESTLSRMRTGYVTPLLGKYAAFADQLNRQIEDATPSEAMLLKKELLALEKKRAELSQFDDKLKHYADMRIKLDLDDGVKVNYGKFGDLLAEVKAITGGTGE